MSAPEIPFTYPPQGRMTVHFNEPGNLGVTFSYPNGYGASVIRRERGGFAGSYGGDRGLFELAVLVGFEVADARQILSHEGDDCFIGWLTAEEVDGLLVRICNLPPR